MREFCDDEELREWIARHEYILIDAREDGGGTVYEPGDPLPEWFESIKATTHD